VFDFRVALSFALLAGEDEDHEVDFGVHLFLDSVLPSFESVIATLDFK